MRKRYFQMALVIISALIMFFWLLSHIETHTWEIGGEYNYLHINELDPRFDLIRVYDEDPVFLRVYCVHGQLYIHIATSYFRRWNPEISINTSLFSIYTEYSRASPAKLIFFIDFSIAALFCITAFYPLFVFCRGPLRRYFLRHEKILNFLYIGGPFVCLFIAFLFIISLFTATKVYCFRLLCGFLDINFGQLFLVGMQASIAIPDVMIHRIPSPCVQLLPRFTLQQTPFYISLWIPLWIPFLLFAYYPFYKRVYIPLMQRFGRFLPDNPNPCSKCGYNLTGNISGICPECGTPTQ